MARLKKQKKKQLKDFRLSIVIPLYNEELTIASLAAALREISPQLPPDTELILVNDGSTDKTAEKILATTWCWPLQLIEFSRNFGHQSALLAGLELAVGEKVVTMDGDLQHPPQLLPKLYALSQNGYDIVLTQRIDTASNVQWAKRISSRLFYSLLNLVSDTPLHSNSSDFRLLNRDSLNQLLSLPEHRKFLRGMVNWIGFTSVIVPFVVEKRAAGTSKYSLAKMLGLAFHGITSFSVIPLYFSGAFSVILFILAFIYALYVLYVKFWTQEVISGWASVLFVLLVLGGFITLFLGLLGLYLAAIYEEVKQRPSYIIRNKHRILQE